VAASWLKSRVSRFVDERLGSDYAAREKALTVRENEFGFDPFGFSKQNIKYAMLFARWLYRDYFRVEAHGIQHVLPRGRVILVANHSGQIPYDGLVIASACFLDATPPRAVRTMLEHFVPTLPFLSYFFSRLGQIVGTPENCRRVLADEEAILVFPEGARGISKPFSKRYQLQEFGLGFLRLALETRSPVVPVAVIGAEEQAPAINVKPLARLLRIPAFPVVPYPPFVPVLPLPVKYRLYFGEPILFDGDADEDDDTLRAKVRIVENRIQSMMHVGLKDRRGVFF
jgi:1-acyl-sn-glycerol-3-phosphate acyltransferase